MTQIVFRAQGVVHRVGGGHVFTKSGEVGATSRWKVVGTECNKSRRVRGISVGIMYVRRECADVGQIARSGRECLSILHERRVKPGVQSIGLNQPVVRESKTPAQNQAIGKVVTGYSARAPGETELRPEIRFGSVVFPTSRADSHSC